MGVYAYASVCTKRVCVCKHMKEKVRKTEREEKAENLAEPRNAKLSSVDGKTASMIQADGPTRTRPNAINLVSPPAVSQYF